MNAGARRENIIMFDTKGCVTKKEKILINTNRNFASEKEYASLDRCNERCRCICRISKGNVVSQGYG
jgi:malic enzyme